MKKQVYIKKQVTLEQYLEHYGYSKKQWEETIDELEKNGISKGCFQDYNLLSLVIGWLINYESIIEIKSEAI